MLILKSIEIKNFRSYGNKPTIYEFKNGMTLITGANTNGKSSAIMAITYALFGKIKGTKIQELVNNINKSNLLVKLHFSVKGDDYIIHRGDYPKVFEIYKNDNKLEINNRISSEQEFLEKEILGINQNIFSKLISLDSSLISNSFFNLSKGQRKQFLEEILDLKILYYIQLEAKEELQKIITLLTENEYKYQNIIQNIKNEEHHINEVQRINQELKNDNTKKIKELEEFIENDTLELNKLQDKLKVISKYEQQLEVLQGKYNELQDIKQNYIREGKKISTRYKKKQQLKNTYQQCIGCDKLNNILNIDISENKIKELYDDILSKKTFVTDIINKLEKIKVKKSELQDKINDKYQIQSEISKYSTYIKKNKIELEKHKQYKILDINTSHLEEYKKSKIDIQKIINELTDKKNEYNTILELVKDEGIKKKIFVKYIPIFNTYVNKYLKKFNLEYNIIIDESFGVTVYDRKKERSYGTFSGSEKLRLSLAIIFSFINLIEKRNNFSINILLIDEMLDGVVSDENLVLLLDFLKMTFKNKEVICISHRHLDKEYFDNIYNIKKQQNFSYIVREE